MRSTIAGRTPRKRPSISDAFRHVPVRSIGRSKSFKEKDRLVRTTSRLSNGSTVSQPISGKQSAHIMNDSSDNLSYIFLFPGVCIQHSISISSISIMIFYYLVMINECVFNS